MESEIIFWIVFIVVIVLGSIATVIVADYRRRKRLKDIVEYLNLIAGQRYEIVLNNGSKILGLTYVRIAYGNNSQNGNVNLYFNKQTKYRGNSFDKETMIKYGNIWQITKLDPESKTITLSQTAE